MRVEPLSVRDPHMALSPTYHISNILRIEILPEDSVHPSPAAKSETAHSVDSGIEHRGSISPSTADFSPRSDKVSQPASRLDLLKDCDSPPPTHAPPPPPTGAQLDQVLIEIEVANNKRRQSSDDDFPAPPAHISKSHCSYPSQTTTGVQYRPFDCKPFRSTVTQQVQAFEQPRIVPDHTVELTVELNKQQNASVSTVRFPRQPIEQVQKTAEWPRSSSLDRTMRQIIPAPTINNKKGPSPAQSTPKKTFTSTIYKAVDIPFDDSVATYQPSATNKDKTGVTVASYGSNTIERKKKEKESELSHVSIPLPSGPRHLGYGFTVNVDGGRPPVVDSVARGGAADRSGVKVGFVIVSINGVSVRDGDAARVADLLAEACDRGTIDMQYRRADSASDFSSARSMFQQLSHEEEETRKRSDSAPVKSTAPMPQPRYELSKSATVGAIGETRTSMDGWRSSTMDREREPRETRGRASTLDRNYPAVRSSPDYRVTAFHDKPGVGKLTDFVPEVERNGEETIVNSVVSEVEKRRKEIESMCAQRKVSMGPVAGEERQGYEPKSVGEPEPEEESVEQTQAHDGRSLLHDPVYAQIEERDAGTDVIYASADELEGATQRVPQGATQRAHRSLAQATRDLDECLRARERTMLRRGEREATQWQQMHYEEIDFGEIAVGGERGVHGRERIAALPHQTPSTVRHVPIHRDFGVFGARGQKEVTFQHQPRMGMAHRQRTRSEGRRREEEQEEEEEEEEQVSPASHRFYDRDGQRVETRQRRVQHRIQVTRDEEEDPREWRNVIEQQRQGTPGQAADRNKIPASASLGNLPMIINKRLQQKQEEERREERDRSVDRMVYHPDRLDTRNPYAVERERREEYTKSRRLVDTVPPAPASQPPRDTGVVAVSGRHRCSHCSHELGRGAAMIIESLSLYYHLACFRCYVCDLELGNGATGADVRVREGKLHCSSCYSNERLQLSKV